MESFDDYRKELTMPQLLVSANCCRHAFEAGQQSKQAEVDELIDTIKTSAESEMYLFDELQKVKGERDELQKRIDVLTRKVNEMAHIFLDDLEEILKGDQS